MYTHACNETHQACQSLKTPKVQEILERKRRNEQKTDAEYDSLPNKTPFPTSMACGLGYDNAVEKEHNKKESIKLLAKSTQSTPSTTNPASKLNILLHNRHALSMQSAQICIFKKMNEECLCGFL